MLTTSPGFKTDFKTFINFGISSEVGYFLNTVRRNIDAFCIFSTTCMTFSSAFPIGFVPCNNIGSSIRSSTFLDIKSPLTYQLSSLKSVSLPNVRYISDSIFRLRKVLTPWYLPGRYSVVKMLQVICDLLYLSCGYPKR